MYIVYVYINDARRFVFIVERDTLYKYIYVCCFFFDFCSLENIRKKEIVKTDAWPASFWFASLIFFDCFFSKALSRTAGSYVADKVHLRPDFIFFCLQFEAYLFFFFLIIFFPVFLFSFFFFFPSVSFTLFEMIVDFLFGTWERILRRALPLCIKQKKKKKKRKGKRKGNETCIIQDTHPIRKKYPLPSSRSRTVLRTADIALLRLLL